MTDQRLNIAGIGLVGGFGQGKQALLDALRNGGKPNGTISVTTDTGQHNLPAYQADVSGVSRFIPPAAARRMNRFAKLALLGASLAIEDAGLPIPLKRKDIGLIVATGFGASKSTFDFLDTMIENQGNFISPTLFSNSVHSSAASHISISLELQGPCLTVSQFEMSPISALLTAHDWLTQGRVKTVILGAVEELCPVLAYCYERFFGDKASVSGPGTRDEWTGANGPIEPFAWEKQTAVMGEGAAFLVLNLDNSLSRYDPALGPGTRDERTRGYIDRFQWTQSKQASIAKPRYSGRVDNLLVLGADGHVCCAKDYRRLSDGVASKIAYTPIYGSFPGGQLFDVIIAFLSAKQETGFDKFCSVKCDADGNCGVIECHSG